MREMVLFVLTLSGLCVAISKEYYYIKKFLTWTDAQTYCRSVYSDLATIENQDDNNAISDIQDFIGYIWIGFYDDLNKWKWALKNEDFNSNSDYDNWGLNEPYDQRTGERCAVMTPLGYWFDISCLSLRFAVCYDDDEDSPAYNFVETAMTWYQARTYCTTHYTDLVTVKTRSENNAIFPVVVGDAWIGLHREPWAWSDSSTSNFTNWHEIASSNPLDMTLCTIGSTLTGLWWQTDCEDEHYFLCQRVSYSQSNTSGLQVNATTTITTATTATKKTTYKLKFKSGEDLTNAAVQQQILKQLHATMKKYRLPDFKLRWIQTDGQIFHKEQKKDFSEEQVQEEDSGPSVVF